MKCIFVAPKKDIVLPHEVAEVEEEDIMPKWGEVKESDTGLDSTE
jgi:hypothetical protein